MAKTCKYQKLQRYISYDNGATWQAMEEYQRGELIEAESLDCGATTILYEDFLKSIAVENKGFIYVIPYSVEDAVVIVSDKEINIKNLYTEVKKEKENIDNAIILSNYIYKYNRNTNQLELIQED